ncbi:MAG: SIMPL domain-containing protein [Balneolaceae bacterium]
MLKRLIPLLLTFAILIIGTVEAQIQQQTGPQISIDMSKSVQLPADLIIFTINLNAEGSTPKEAFDLHKERERLLASLLKKLKIDANNIKFQPVQINKRYRNDDKNMYSQTSQQVNVTFSDFGIYESIQLTLIENGFDTFSGSFSSTKLEEGKNDALKLAINSAKEKANFIAQTSGIKLGAIQKINYSEYQINTGYRAMEMKAMVSSDSTLLDDFPQTVSVTAGVHISFLIED